MLYVTREHIPAGSSVYVSEIDGLAQKDSPVWGFYLGDAVEALREGFRVVERDGEVREDDA
jgi:hypothetical protein